MFRANVLKVMIASPGDVPEERRAVTEEIYRWNDANASARQLVLMPVKWETHSTPQMGGHPQEIINRQLLHDADILIGIFGTRIGTPTVDYLSGTVEEIKRHVADGRTAKVYFSDVPVPPSEINAAQYAQVQGFRDECRSSGLYASFNSIHDFSRDFRHHLDIELNQPRYRWLAVPALTAEDERPLTQDALRLLIAAAEDDGQFILQEGVDGDRLRVGDDEFIDGTPRSGARWRQAIEELSSAGAVEEVSDRIFRVTAIGFKIVDESDDSTAEVVSAFDEVQRSSIGTS